MSFPFVACTQSVRCHNCCEINRVCADGARDGRGRWIDGTTTTTCEAQGASDLVRARHRLCQTKRVAAAAINAGHSINAAFNQHRARMCGAGEQNLMCVVHLGCESESACRDDRPSAVLVHPVLPIRHCLSARFFVLYPQERGRGRGIQPLVDCRVIKSAFSH